MNIRKYLLIFITLLGGVAVLYAEAAGSTLFFVNKRMTELIIQVGLILIASKIGGSLAKMMKQPPILGEIIAGIIIGPYLLGGVPVPMFNTGVFHLNNANLAVMPELYGIAVIGSLILIFHYGIESDLSLLTKVSLPGFFIGVTGTILSFVCLDAVTALLLKTDFFDRRAVFMGVLGVATSINIAGRVLKSSKRLDSPEGVTIQASAVIDDLLGLVMLAAVLALTELSGNSKSIDWAKVSNIPVKLILIWSGLVVFGFVFARYLGRFLKIFKSVKIFSILALAISFIIAGVFERSGLSMLIGAYIMGLALSKTDISFAINNELHSIFHFFVPIFFTVIGMLINVKLIFSFDVIVFCVVYTVVAIVVKVVGCGAPAFALNFNLMGAARIGVGMIPRGEVALIIAGIGISSGILSSKLFSAGIFMVFISALIYPPIMTFLLKNKKTGLKKDEVNIDKKIITYDFPSSDIKEIVVSKIVKSLETEGFFITSSGKGRDNVVFQLRKEDVFFTMYFDDRTIYLSTSDEDVSFVKTVVYESIVNLYNAVEKIKSVTNKPEIMKKDLTDDNSRVEVNILKVLTKECIKVNLESRTKEDVIIELIDILDNAGLITDREEIVECVMQREASMSTGMQFGIALPHGKIDKGVKSMCAALGISRKGVDFDSLDGQPSNIFILLISPKSNPGPHIQFLSAISTIFNDGEARDRVLTSSNSDEVWSVLEEYYKKIIKK